MSPLRLANLNNRFPGRAEANDQLADAPVGERLPQIQAQQRNSL